MPADPDIIRKYSKGECEVLRHEVVQDTFLPQVKQNFDVYPILNSVIFMVAQYFDDEGEEQMHFSRIFASSSNPDIKSHLQFLRNIAGSEDYHSRIHEIDRGLWKKLLEFVPDGEITYSGKYDLSSRSRWLQNHMAIALFGCFAPEGADQNQRFHENYAPCIIFRRTKSGHPDYELIGENVRPWLEGTIGYSDFIYEFSGARDEENYLKIRWQTIEKKLIKRANDICVEIKVLPISENLLSVHFEKKEIIQILLNKRINKGSRDLLLNVLTDEAVEPSHIDNTPVTAVEMLEKIVASLRKTL